MTRVKLALVLLLFPALALGQSLAEVARHEKERRDDNKKQGQKASLVIGDIGSGQDGEGPNAPLVGSADPEPSAAEPVTEEMAPRASTEEDRAGQEMEWRRRNSEARERLEEARKRYELLSKLHLNTGAYYVDQNNNPVITSVEQLQSMVAQSRAELDAATAALSQLREDARRAGVPPGWVR
jgi:hypothetical protein